MQKAVKEPYCERRLRASDIIKTWDDADQTEKDSPIRGSSGNLNSWVYANWTPLFAGCCIAGECLRPQRLIHSTAPLRTSAAVASQTISRERLQTLPAGSFCRRFGACRTIGHFSSAERHTATAGFIFYSRKPGPLL